MTFDPAYVPTMNGLNPGRICRDCAAFFTMLYREASRCPACGSVNITIPTPEETVSIATLLAGSPMIIEAAMSDNNAKAMGAQAVLRGAQAAREGLRSLTNSDQEE